MAGFWVWCAAMCAALASTLHMVGSERTAARRLRELDGLARLQIALAGRGNALQRRLLEVCPGWEPSPTLLLQLLEAAIAQGVAIPRALECIGACCGGACAQVLGHVSAALLRGVCWDEAWAVLEHDGSSPASSALGLIPMPRKPVRNHHVPTRPTPHPSTHRAAVRRRHAPAPARMLRRSMRQCTPMPEGSRRPEQSPPQAVATAMSETAPSRDIPRAIAAARHCHAPPAQSAGAPARQARATDVQQSARSQPYARWRRAPRTSRHTTPRIQP